MKTLVAMFVLALTTPALAKGNNAKDEEAIKAQTAAFDEAWNKNDAKAVAALFTDDATVIDPMGMEFNGKAAIEKTFEGMFAGPAKGSKHSITPRHITFIKPDVALGDADI